MRLSDRFRLFRVKQRWMRAPVRRTRFVATVAVLLATAVVALAVVERRGEGRELAMADFVRLHAIDPMEAIIAGFRAHRRVILGDVSGATAPKLFAADVIVALARGLGLDIVAIEVGADLQPVIDRYLDADVEDIAPLLANPRLLRSTEGAPRAWLALYRRVWQLNRELGADRRVRILAIDRPGWPPDRAISPTRLLHALDEREAALVNTIEEHVGRRGEAASILFFVDGLHALRTSIRVEHGAASAGATMLAARLGSRGPARAFSVLVDAGPTAGTLPHMPVYRPGRLYQLTRRTAPGRNRFALTPVGDFPATAADLATAAPPGIIVRIDPAGTSLAGLIDLYIRLQ